MTIEVSDGVVLIRPYEEGDVNALYQAVSRKDAKAQRKAKRRFRHVVNTLIDTKSPF